MSKVCLSIQYYKEFLIHAVLNQGTSDENPTIPQDILAECKQPSLCQQQ